MIALSSKVVAEYAGGVHQGQESRCFDIKIDSRKVAPGDVFFALRSGLNDGHLFIGEAIAKGASCVVFDDPLRANAYLPTAKIAFIQTKDVLASLQNFARSYRQGFPVKMVGITGSAGKTSTRDMVALVLSGSGIVIKNEKNFNNEIGVPLTLSKIETQTKFGVIEMGMRGRGQIEDLCRLVDPDIGIITNIGYSHIELLKEQKNIMLAKRELIDALPFDGIAVLPYDDPWFDSLKDGFIGRVVTFGSREGSNIRYSVIDSEIDSTTGEIVTSDGEIARLELQTGGVQHLQNAAAAIACGWSIGLPLQAMVESLRNFQPEAMRFSLTRLSRGNIIINDAYNASPAAVEMALLTIARSQAKKRMFIFGDMLELGEYAEKLHRQVAQWVVASKIDLLITVGSLSRFTHEEILTADSIAAYHFDSVDQSVSEIPRLIDNEWLILVKASRSVGLERIVDAIIKEIVIQ
jgi:UDP-N-acetylmuramoyl-tripeptide--D-alanyl-D-alanine ligase